MLGRGDDAGVDKELEVLRQVRVLPCEAVKEAVRS
jgi:hypothetical protein